MDFRTKDKCWLGLHCQSLDYRVTNWSKLQAPLCTKSMILLEQLHPELDQSMVLTKANFARMTRLEIDFLLDL